MGRMAISFSEIENSEGRLALGHKLEGSAWLIDLVLVMLTLRGL